MIRQEVKVFKLLLMSFFCLVCWQTQRPWRYHTAEETEKVFSGTLKWRRPNIELRWTVALAKQMRRNTRAMWEESEEFCLFTLIKPTQFLYWQEAFFSLPPEPFLRATPDMNPSSLSFSRQCNLSARSCVGIPQVWVLHTQNSQTAPAQKEWKTPESLLCVVALLSSIKLVCVDVLSASFPKSSHI